MPDHPEVVRLRAQLANQRAHIVELVSMQQRREETLTSMLRELTEVVRSEIERADNAQAELERLRQSFHAAVAVSQREPKGIPNGGTLEAQRSQAHAPAASVPIPTSSVLAEPSAPPGASQLTRHTRYARALLERAAQQKARAANAENIAVAKQHFEAAKQASASSDHELACSHLEDAYVLNPKPTTLVSLANMHLHLGGVDIAKELYKHVLQDPAASQPTRNAVEEKLRQCNIGDLGVVE